MITLKYFVMQKTNMPLFQNEGVYKIDFIQLQLVLLQILKPERTSFQAELRYFYIE